MSSPSCGRRARRTSTARRQVRERLVGPRTEASLASRLRGRRRVSATLVVHAAGLAVHRHVLGMGVENRNHRRQRIRLPLIVAVEEDHELRCAGRSPRTPGCVPTPRRRSDRPRHGCAGRRRRTVPTTSAVPSVDPSSKTTSSQSATVCACTLSSAVADVALAVVGRDDDRDARRWPPGPSRSQASLVEDRHQCARRGVGRSPGRTSRCGRRGPRRCRARPLM